MEDVYNFYHEEEDEELFVKHVVGDDPILLNLSRFLDKAYTDDEDL